MTPPLHHHTSKISKYKSGGTQYLGYFSLFHNIEEYKIVNSQKYNIFDNDSVKQNQSTLSKAITQGLQAEPLRSLDCLAQLSSDLGAAIGAEIWHHKKQ